MDQHLELTAAMIAGGMVGQRHGAPPEEIARLSVEIARAIHLEVNGSDGAEPEEPEQISPGTPGDEVIAGSEAPAAPARRSSIVPG
jgi:hypothetical protein